MFTEKKDLIAYARLNFMRFCVAYLVVLGLSIFLGVHPVLDLMLYFCFLFVANFSYIFLVMYPHYLLLQLTPKSDAGKYKYHGVNAMLPFTKKELYWRYIKPWFVICPIGLFLIWLLYQRFSFFILDGGASFTSGVVFLVGAFFFFLQASILKIRSLAKNKPWFNVQPRIFIVDLFVLFLLFFSPATWLIWMILLSLLIYCVLEFVLASDDLEKMHQ